MSDDAPIQPGMHASGSPQRPASVTLRTQAQADESAQQLDAANQSLADALNLVFRLIQVGMIGLVVYFIASGVQSIKETESGIKLLFGKIAGDNLPPGPQFSWPYPFGEMIRVDTGAVTLELDDSFMPQMTPDQKKLSIAAVAQQGTKVSLKPGEDGSLITGDESIAHTKWKVLYRRVRPGDFAANVLPEDEKRIVQAAVEQGVVQATATVKIDDLLKQSQGDSGSVAKRAKEIAQGNLDKLGAGIQIEQLTLQEKCPPFYVFNDFNSVQSAEQKASQQRSDAESVASNLLNETAGAAYEPLIQQIDLYEGAVEKNDKPEQERILATINALLLGDAVTIGDKKIEQASSGRVASTLSEARQYRTSIVARRRAEAENFGAILAQFKSNPEVVVQRDWANAMTKLLARQNVEIFSLPPGTETAEILINRDQDYEKAVMQAIKQLRNLQAKEMAEQKQRDARFKTDTTLQELPTSPGGSK